MIKQKKSLGSRIQKEWNRFLQKAALAMRDPAKLIRHEYSRVLRRIVLAGPDSLQDMLRQQYDSESMEPCLLHLRDRGYLPGTIIDGGAFVGGWTRMVKKLFPQVRVIMIEPQADKRPILTGLQNEFPGTVEFVSCLLGPASKDAVPFYEMESGSSVYQEMTDLPRRGVTVQMRTLDDVLAEKKVVGPIFLKLDVQGFEIEVLKGARQTLEKANLVLLEIALLEFNEGSPLFYEIVQFMGEQGFLAYDICNLSRWYENVLSHVDIFFIRKDSPLRKLEPLSGNKNIRP